MSHKHKVTLEKVFAHPIATSIDWKKLSHALEHYGAEIDLSKHNHAKVVVGDKEFSMSLPHHGHEISDKSEVTHLRHFLESVDLTPDKL